MADLRYLSERAEACRAIAQRTTDRSESKALLDLASLYERQVQQFSRRSRQVQG